MPAKKTGVHRRFFRENDVGGRYYPLYQVVSTHMVMIGVNQHISFLVATDGHYTFLV